MSVILRYYQNEAVAAVLGEFMSVRSTLVVAATGTGKTTIFSELARSWPGNVLILAHRDELIEQARKRLEHDTGEFVEVEKAEFVAYAARIVVGSVQTLCKIRRLRRFKPDHFGLIIVDEAHRAPAASYQTILNYFTKAKILGVTATPDRSDGLAMGRTFQSVAYQLDILDAIQDGWLVPIRGHRERIEDFDLSSVASSKLTGGETDLAPGELDEAVVLAVDAMIKRTVELYPRRKAILFTPGVRSAQVAAEKLNLIEPGCAIVIHGETDPEERRKLVTDFKDGKYRYFCNCQIATEGADFPDVDLIVMMRPTLSRSLFMQMVGRGTRTLPGVVDRFDGPELAAERRAAILASAKPHMTVLDFVGNTGRHNPVGVEDILGGKYSLEQRAKVKKDAEETGEDYDPLAALAGLDAARQALAQMAHLEVGAIKSHTEIFDFFGPRSTDRADSGVARHGRDVRSATEGQRRVLVSIGVSSEEAGRMTFAQATRFINACDHRKSLGLATFKQMRLLKDWGVTAKNVPIKTASEAVNVIVNSRFRKSADIKQWVAEIVARDVPSSNGAADQA